jgi:hypothetical protein
MLFTGKKQVYKKHIFHQFFFFYESREFLQAIIYVIFVCLWIFLSILNFL